MAIDTRNKRSSAINVGSPWFEILPEPDGSVTQSDRQALCFLYSGISAGSSVAVITPGGRIAFVRPEDRTVIVIE